MITKLSQCERFSARKSAIYSNRLARASQAGFTIIELMISLALGIAISWVVLDIALTGVRNNQNLVTSAEVTENGRYLSNFLEYELNHAGFYGQSQTIIPVGAVPPRNMCTSSVSTNDLLYPIHGINDFSSGALACVSDILLGSDVLMIRRASTGADIALVNLEDNQHYVQSNMDQVVLGTLASSDTVFTLQNMTESNAAPILDFNEHIYYVDTSGNFKRRSLVGSGYVTEPLAEGVDDFQVQYHIDTDDEHFADIVRDIPSNDNEWKNVRSVSIFLLMKSTTNSNQTDDKTYSYAGKTNGPFGDSRQRRLFTSVAALNLRDPITITTTTLEIDNFSFENNVTGTFNTSIQSWAISNPDWAGTVSRDGGGLIVSNFLDSHGVWIWHDEDLNSDQGIHISYETDENYDENSVYEFKVNIGDGSWPGSDYAGPGAYMLKIKVGDTELAAAPGVIPDENSLKLATVSSKDFPPSSTLTGKVKVIIKNTGTTEILADYVRGTKTTTIIN